MKKITLLTIGLLIMLGCSEDANEITLKDEQSIILDKPILIKPQPDPNEGTVYLQVQNLEVGFNDNITIVYTAANISSIRLYLERRRERSYPFAVNQYFNGVEPVDKKFLQTVTFTNEVNSGTLSLALPANVFYDNNYQVKAYNAAETQVLATSNNFTIGTPNLTINTVNSREKFYENSPGLITYSSNMDPHTLMIIEIKRPGERIKRFVTNAIPSDYQVYGFNHRSIWSGYSLIGKLSNLRAGDINNTLYPPTTNIFSQDDYIIRIYPYGYSGISDSVTGLEFIESKTEWNTPQTPYLVKKTRNATNKTLKLEPFGFPYNKLRYDLYLNGKFVKVLSASTSNPYTLQLSSLKNINSSPYAIWRVRATFVEPGTGYMGSVMSMVYISNSWL